MVQKRSHAMKLTVVIKTQPHTWRKSRSRKGEALTIPELELAVTILTTMLNVDHTHHNDQHTIIYGIPLIKHAHKPQYRQYNIDRQCTLRHSYHGNKQNAVLEEKHTRYRDWTSTLEKSRIQRAPSRDCLPWQDAHRHTQRSELD